MLPNLARLAPTGGGVGGDPGLGGGQSDQQLRKAYEEAEKRVEALGREEDRLRYEFVNVHVRAQQVRNDMLVAHRHQDDGLHDLIAAFNGLVGEKSATMTQYQEAVAAHQEATMHRDKLREQMHARGLLVV